MDKTAKTEKRKNKKKVRYPRYSAIESFEIVKKATREYGDRIIPYTDFAKSLGLGEPKGGTYSLKTEALKLYDLMDRVGYTEIGVTLNGKKILDAPPSEQKRLLFESTVRISIFADLFQRFSQLPTKRKAMINYLLNKNYDRRDAGKIVSVFVKNHEEFSSLITSKVFGPQEPVSKIGISEGVDKSLIKFIYRIGSLFPSQESENLKQALTTLTEISKSKNLKSTSALLESLSLIYSDEKDMNRIKEGLEKAKQLIFQKLEEDLNIEFELEGSSQN